MSDKIKQFMESGTTQLSAIKNTEVSFDDIDNFGNKASVNEMFVDMVKYRTMLKQKITFINGTLTSFVPFTRENLYLVCAYSGSGKSTICANVSYPLWKEGKKTLVISNEESKHDVLFRIACLELGYNFNDYKKGTMPNDMAAKAMALFPDIAKYVKVLDINYKDGLTTKVEGVKNALEKIKDQGYSCAMIDYFQLIQFSVSDPKKDRYSVLTDFRIWLGQYIKKSDIPIVLFAQLHSMGKRKNEDLDSRIKDCPSVYETATVVIEVVPDFKNKCSNFVIKKDRFGLQGTRMTMGFENGRFINYTAQFQAKVDMVNQQAAADLKKKQALEMFDHVVNKQAKTNED